MCKISFIAFSANDNPDEEKRVGLFIESLLSQSEQDWELLFMDMSDDDKKFNIPKDERICSFTPNIARSGNWWNPVFFRNYGVDVAKGDLVCHTNSDCIFAPNFAEVLLVIGGRDRLLTCQRRNTSEKQFRNIKTLQEVQQLVTQLDLHGQGCCGDCQCMDRKQFLEIGGFYGLIQDGVVACRHEDKFKYREDSWLQYKVNKQNWGEYPFSKETHNIREIWITDKTWIVHLWHPERENIKKWHERND